MPSIKVTDASGVEIPSVSIHPTSPRAALLKYLHSSPTSFIFLPQLVQWLRKPLSEAGRTAPSLGFHAGAAMDFGSGPDLSITPSLSQTICPNTKTGSPLIAASLFGPAITVGEGECWLSVVLCAALEASIHSDGAQLDFGFDAGRTISMQYARCFPPTLTVAEAVSQLLSTFSLPADAADLDAMQPRDIAALSGSGNLKLSANLELELSANPLASPALPLYGKSIALQSAAKLSLAASISLSGSYQIRVQALPSGRKQIGFYRQHGIAWQVSARASAGFDLDVENTDLLATLLGKLAGDPAFNVARLRQAGLDDSAIQKIASTVSDSINHSLQASLELAFSDSNDNEAAFLYSVDTAALDVESSAALHAALDGDLTQLTALEAKAAFVGHIAPGIVLQRSELQTILAAKHSLKLNLIGLLNYSSVVELVSKSQAVYEPISGELTLLETESNTQVGVLTSPAEQNKLRTLQYNALLITTAYRASRAVAAMDLNCCDTYFTANSSTPTQLLDQYFDEIAGLGLVSSQQRDTLERSARNNGPSSLLLGIFWNDATCESLFLTDGKPRVAAEYEELGRKAICSMLQSSTDRSDQDRLRTFSDNALWPRLRECGSVEDVERALPPGVDSSSAPVIHSDLVAIEWWADAMSSAGPQVAGMRAYIATANPATLNDDHTFAQMRQSLQKSFANALKNSALDHSRPFGLLALHAAAITAEAHGRLTVGANILQFPAR